MQVSKSTIVQQLKRSNILNEAVAVEISSFLVILLFLYAAINKLVIIPEFQQQMMQSPLLPRQLIPILAFFVPLLEIAIAWMLVFNRTKLLGFYLAYFTMLTFTCYLIILVSVAENAPCSCGGILGQMGYTEHIIFNAIFVGITLFGSLKFKTPEHGVNSVSK